MYGSLQELLADIEAVIYARVSDNRDGRSRSVKQQVGEGERWCERHGVPIAKIIVDDDKGASRYSRKVRDGYEKILGEELRPSGGKRRILVSWESSRAQRDLEVYVKLRRVCEENGALWCYDGRVYDMTDPDDRKRTAQDAVDDEYEVEKTRKRVLRDMGDNLTAGRPHGKLAYGYRIVRDPRDGKPINRVPDEDTDERRGTAPIVREIARRLLARESARSIAKDLNARGIPAPRPGRDGQAIPWSALTLVRMMKSPTYAGLRTHGGVVTGPGTWEAIIDKADHERLLALLGNPNRLTHRGSEPRWLLSNIARCGVCGGRMRPLKPRGHRTYVCIEKFCVARSAKDLDRLVEQAILERLESPDVLELLASNDEQAATAYEEANRLRQRLEAFVDQAADVDNPLSPAALARIEAKLKPQIAAAERRARAAIKSPIVAELAGGSARSKWKALTVSERRDVVATLVEVVVHKARSGTRFNPRYVSLQWAGADNGPVSPPVVVPLSEGGDPADFTVSEVLAYLRDVDYEERIRVIEAERRGMARHKILLLSTDSKRARTPKWREQHR